MKTTLEKIEIGTMDFSDLKSQADKMLNKKIKEAYFQCRKLNGARYIDKREKCDKRLANEYIKLFKKSGFIITSSKTKKSVPSKELIEFFKGCLYNSRMYEDSYDLI